MMSQKSKMQSNRLKAGAVQDCQLSAKGSATVQESIRLPRCPRESPLVFYTNETLKAPKTAFARRAGSENHLSTGRNLSGFQAVQAGWDAVTRRRLPGVKTLKQVCAGKPTQRAENFSTVSSGTRTHGDAAPGRTCPPRTPRTPHPSRAPRPLPTPPPLQLGSPRELTF